MRLKVLGCSGGEYPGMSLTAFALDDQVLLDAGTVGAKLTDSEQWKIRKILITHSHLDHIRGIPFLADNIVVRRKRHKVDLYAIPHTLRALKRNLLNDNIWPDFTAIPDCLHAVLRLNPIRPGSTFKVAGYTVTPYRVAHTVPAVGYAISDARGTRLIYTGDCGPSTEIWRATEEPSDCLIIEVSFPNRMRQFAIMTGHLTTGLLKEELKKMKCRPGRLLITHPKPQYRQTIAKELRRSGIKNLKLLADGQVHEV